MTLAVPPDLTDEWPSSDVRRLHPHGSVLLVPVAVLLGGLALVGFLAAALPPGAGPAKAAGLVVVAVVLLRFSLLPYLRWLSTVLVLEPTRLRVRTGLLRRRSRELPLRTVRAVVIERSARQRLLGSGTLVVEPAGLDAPVVVRNVPRVREAADYLADRIEELRPDGGARDGAW